MRLLVYENKTKYIVMTRNATAKGNICIEGLIFEQVGDFKYLGVNIYEKTNVCNEIRMRLNAANRCHFTMKGTFSSKLLSRRKKWRLYCTYLRDVVQHPGDEGKLQIYRRNIIGKFMDR